MTVVDRTAADFRSYLELYERAPLLELGELADRARWTLHLLADKMVELKVLESISHETVRQALKKTN